MKLYDNSILEGAIDIHIHVGPDYMARYADCITLAEEAAACGMRAFVAKCHLTSTVGATAAANLVVSGVRAIGSITLNGPTGGLSPRSVIIAVKSGAKVVWLPTVDAKYGYEKASQGHWIGHYVSTSSFGYPTEQLSILDNSGALKEEAREILRICKNEGVALCSGHISPAECLALAREAKVIGFKNLEITHANAWIEDFTIGVMKELAELGAYISISYGACSPRNGRQDPEEILSIIKQIGAKNLILMTDYGQVVSPAPVEGLRVFYYLMKNLGISGTDIDLMIKKNPAKFLNLEE